MMQKTQSILTSICALACVASANSAPQEEPDTSTEDPNTPTWGISGGDIFQFESSLDDGGAFTVNRAFASGKMKKRFSEGFALTMDAAFEADTYNFSGSGPFVDAGGGSPWTTTLALTVRALGRFTIDEQNHFFAGGLVSWAGETGAGVGDSFTGGGQIGYTHTFSKDLTLGAGLQISTRIEDDLLYVPTPIIDWHISEQLYLTNARSPEAFPASLGIELLYYLSRELSVSIGTRYEYRRFRLDDSGPALTQGGVGVDKGFPVWARLEWRPMGHLRVHLVGGVSFGERLELADSSGDVIEERDVDAAPFLGFFLGFEF